MSCWFVTVKIQNAGVACGRGEEFNEMLRIKIAVRCVCFQKLKLKWLENRNEISEAAVLRCQMLPVPFSQHSAPVLHDIRLLLALRHSGQFQKESAVFFRISAWFNPRLLNVCQWHVKQTFEVIC